MKFWINFSKGFQSTKKTTGMVLLLFLINLGFSLILAVPMYHSLKESFGSSLVGESMAEGFDMLWWEEFRDQSEGLEKTFAPFIIGKGAILNNLEMLVQMRFFSLPPLLLFFGLAYIILHTFLAGGILTTLNSSVPRFSMRSFFEGAGRHFIKFLVIAIVSWVFFFGLLGNLNLLLGALVTRVAERSFSEVTPFYLGLLFSAIILFLILLIQMIFDYARIAVIAENEGNVFRAILKALGFVFRNPGSTLSLYYTLFAVQVVVTLFYILLEGLIPQSRAGGVIAAFAWQQLFIFAVVGIRCWIYASQLELYKYIPNE